MKTLANDLKSRRDKHGSQLAIQFKNCTIQKPILKSKLLVSEDGELKVQSFKVNEQTLDSSIFTMNGWKLIPEVKVGEKLASIDGLPNTLISTYSSGIKDIYKICLSDERTIKLSGDHQYLVSSWNWKSHKRLSVLELIEYLNKPSYQNRLWIQLFSGIHGSNRQPGIDPWILGYLLGNGSMQRSVTFATDDAFCLFKMSSRLGDKFKITHSDKYRYRIVNAKASRTNDLLGELRNMGLGSVNAYTKFIPINYFNSSKDNRLLLLQGLMDSDGWCEKSGSLRYSSSSPQLAKDVMKLVWSLGGIGSIKKKGSPKYTYKGESKIGAPSYTCRIRFSDPENYVTTYKKQKRARNSCTPRLTISSVSYLGREEVYQLETSHPTNSYVTNDYLIT